MATKRATGRLAAEVAAGLAAAAAAGYYFYASKDAKKHRQIAAKWASDMKREVVRQAKKLEKITGKDVVEIVDTVADTYRNVRSINPRELRQAAAELKRNWRVLQQEIRPTTSRVRKAVTKRASSSRTRK